MVGAPQYDKIWNTGFTDFAFYRAGNTNFLLRYNPVSGEARINSFGASLNGIQLVLDQAWSKGWTLIRFFRIGNKTDNFRYDPQTGRARIQEINSNGTFGPIKYDSTKWLQAYPGSGIFDPPTTGCFSSDGARSRIASAAARFGESRAGQSSGRMDQPPESDLTPARAESIHLESHAPKILARAQSSLPSGSRRQQQPPVIGRIRACKGARSRAPCTGALCSLGHTHADYLGRESLPWRTVESPMER